MEHTDPTGHPRPLLRRPWTSLDGPWGFAADPDLAGTVGAVSFDRTIEVPYAPETPASGVHWTGPLHRAWYRRRLPGRAGDRRTVLHLGAVDRVCDVWVGGAHVAHHEGGYTPFAVDVTDALGDDGADLVVRADDDPRDLAAPRGKQDWRDEPHAIWYPRTTGIWRTAWLEQVAARRIADVQWRGDPHTLRVDVRVELAVPVSGARLHLRLRAGDRLLVDDVVRVDGAVVERTVQVGDGGVDDREGLLWHPGPDPVLLDAELALVADDGEVLDEVASYTALRSVAVGDGRLLVNDRPVPLRLVLDQGYWPGTGATPPDVAALRRDLELTRALGFTGARKHQKTEDPRYLALADRMGLLVWAEMPSAYRPGPTASARLLREWTEVVVAHRGHPSVVTWVPLNESWGVQEAVVDGRQRGLVRAMAATADALDGTRPVSANDGWETLGGDVLGVHDYEQDPAVLGARYASAESLERVARGRRPDGRLADLDRAGVAGRAVVLSEFGGVALRGPADEGWGYADATSPEDLLARYRAQWAAVHDSSALAGACWTQLTDTHQEVNGLLTADREPKADLDALRRATLGEG
ncbi:glycoside hydrolase family 2 protein [Geodermatophilus sp. DSM 44513]|uniref:glycoside hydrolase family 2 protein n=1 Tax=Geodermatophilus sp. DSM 44513 TaxID=1528104 RepID=UPI001286C878|nr:glycoside hydrolase family 2 TIM barrel-domain containing protein [Geodermatophilus sp. DSM 44513]WNV75973.1 glycoside hydrolase family 2 TIM barrel-domain containing protein [Geodermatophilus sp. DSM 44513]